jgi:ATP adenylyltransferase
MKKLYAPWRTPYTKTIDSKKEGDACVFCAQIKDTNDEHNFILARYKHCFVILNLYPYNAGHLLIIPYKHVAGLEQLSDEERSEIMNVTNKALVIVNKQLKCDGINIGMNLGKASGGSLLDHIHQHLVPRWYGDTNFLPVLTEEVKTISFDLKEIYKDLKPLFTKLNL